MLWTDIYIIYRLWHLYYLFSISIHNWSLIECSLFLMRFPIHHHWCLLLLLLVCTFFGQITVHPRSTPLEVILQIPYGSEATVMNAPIKHTPNFGVQHFLVRHSTDFCCLFAAGVGKGQGGPGALLNLQQPWAYPDLHLQVVSPSCQVSSHHNPVCPHLQNPVCLCSQSRGEKRGVGEETSQASCRPYICRDILQKKHYFSSSSSPSFSS